jgi:hypothetical protein
MPRKIVGGTVVKKAETVGRWTELLQDVEPKALAGGLFACYSGEVEWAYKHFVAKYQREPAVIYRWKVTMYIPVAPGEPAQGFSPFAFGRSDR